MSTTPTTQPAPAVTLTPPAEREIRVYSHSGLFYWWPVWAFGFLMALLTFVQGGVLAVVPKGTIAVSGAKVEYQKDNQLEAASPRDVLVMPAGAKVVNPNAPDNPHLHMAYSKNFGVVFAVVLLVIVLISNVPMHGFWSVFVLMGIAIFVLIMVLAGWWETFVEKFQLVDIRINAGGYLFISAVLFVIWAVTVFIFDHRHYVIVTPGQVRVCMAVGTGETVYDTTGMTFQKRQDDLFRHWIVGLGSGDLIMHRTNMNQEVDMPNVLFISAKIQQIERLMKEREVV